MITMPDSLQTVLDGAFHHMSQARERFTPQLELQEIGTITTVFTGIATVAGLPGAGYDELL
ncbi:hypothetical protein N9C66_04920, partial [Akkermansiaceae bacterium]|nr:hypothetical protein [Akkermansiaceae bacterium]